MIPQQSSSLVEWADALARTAREQRELINYFFQQLRQIDNHPLAFKNIGANRLCDFLSDLTLLSSEHEQIIKFTLINHIFQSIVRNIATLHASKLISFFDNLSIISSHTSEAWFFSESDFSDILRHAAKDPRAHFGLPQILKSLLILLSHDRIEPNIIPENIVLSYFSILKKDLLTLRQIKYIFLALDYFSVDNILIHKIDVKWLQHLWKIIVLAQAPSSDLFNALSALGRLSDAHLLDRPLVLEQAAAILQALVSSTQSQEEAGHLLRSLYYMQVSQTYDWSQQHEQIIVLIKNLLELRTDMTYLFVALSALKIFSEYEPRFAAHNHTLIDKILLQMQKQSCITAEQSDSVLDMLCFFAGDSHWNYKIESGLLEYFLCHILAAPYDERYYLDNALIIIKQILKSHALKNPMSDRLMAFLSEKVKHSPSLIVRFLDIVRLLKNQDLINEQPGSFFVDSSLRMLLQHNELPLNDAISAISSLLGMTTCQELKKIEAYYIQALFNVVLHKTQQPCSLLFLLDSASILMKEQCLAILACQHQYEQAIDRFVQLHPTKFENQKMVALIQRMQEQGLLKQSFSLYQHNFSRPAFGSDEQVLMVGAAKKVKVIMYTQNYAPVMMQAGQSAAYCHR